VGVLKLEVINFVNMQRDTIDMHRSEKNKFIARNILGMNMNDTHCSQKQYMPLAYILKRMTCYIPQKIQELFRKTAEKT
jgi:hypothetical protein